MNDLDFLKDISIGNTVSMGKDINGKNIEKESTIPKGRLAESVGARIISDKEVNNSFTSLSMSELTALEDILQSRAEYAKSGKGKFDFKQVRQILPIDEWLEDEYYVPFTKSIYPYWKELILKIFKGQEFSNHSISYNEIVAGGCFTIDTKVSLLDGTERDFKELLEMQSRGETIWVYSFNRDTGEIEAKIASNVRKVKENQRLLKVTLDNGISYRCTLDHKHLRRDNSWCRADELKIGDSLMPLYRDVTPVTYRVDNIEHLKETEDVYCMEVEDNHNFALSAGIFVHNSIGIGKSTLAAVLIMRMLYILSCFENIQSFYGLMPGSPLYIVIISVNREVAEATLYGDLKTKIDMCDYFTEKFPRNQRINSLIAFPNDITVIFGSNVNSVIGKNVICFAADEMGFRREAAEDTNRFYAYLLARNKSRFVHSGGKDGSLAILLSSATTSTSVVEQRKIESIENKSIIAVDPKLWEVKPKAYSNNRFPVFTGTITSDPCVIDNSKTLNRLISEEGLALDIPFRQFSSIQDEWNFILYEVRDMLPDYLSEAIIEVPTELKDNFKSNLNGSLQDLAGVAVSPSSKLFTSKRVYNECINDELYYPFKSDCFKLSTNDDITVLDYIKSDAHIRIPDRLIPRFIHIDGSFAGNKDNREADHTGITCLHISGFKTSPTGVRLPIITVDFFLEIEAPEAPAETSLEKVLNVVFSMEEFCGLNIKQGMVTYDGFQSQFSVQLLDKNNYNVSKLSVDRTDGPYIDLINMMYEGRLKFKNHTTVQKELFDLIHYRDRGKVDHPSGGSKDLVDSLCGAVQSALKSDYLSNMAYNKIDGNFIDSNEYLYKKEEELKNKMKPSDELDYNINSLVGRLWRRGR